MLSTELIQKTSGIITNSYFPSCKISCIHKYVWVYLLSLSTSRYKNWCKSLSTQDPSTIVCDLIVPSILQIISKCPEHQCPQLWSNTPLNYHQSFAPCLLTILYEPCHNYSFVSTEDIILFLFTCLPLWVFFFTTSSTKVRLMYKALYSRLSSWMLYKNMSNVVIPLLLKSKVAMSTIWSHSPTPQLGNFKILFL